MKFIGENLLPGQLGHFLIILAFVASILSAVAYFMAFKNRENTLEYTRWRKLASLSFITQWISLIIVFGLVFYICKNHLYEYMYAYKHASRELENKFLLACIWEGQEGSFLLWSLLQGLLGCAIIYVERKKSIEKTYESPVMAIVSVAQFFLVFMILGIYIGDERIGNSLFSLTRNEIAAPIFSQPNYLEMIQDGMGLNPLLRNYWMVIHPPVLFAGFSATSIPFAYAFASLMTKRYKEWATDTLPWLLFAAAVLGVGIMMGGKWAYESLSFGGYWAWDPVENASLVPWLLLIAGIHTLLIYKSTGHSAFATYLFMFLAYGFILYSTFLTRTGILGETSVHSFTEAGKAINIMIGLFLFIFTIPAWIYLIIQRKKIPSLTKEEQINSREFWMFIGSLIFFISGLFISAKTSIPVFNKILGTNWAQPEDVEFSYNKVIVMVGFMLGVLTAFTQYLKYKSTSSNYLKKNLLIPTIISIVLFAILAIVYPFTWHKHGVGFLVAIYLCYFGAIYAVVANAYYIIGVLKNKMINAGGSLSHLGFCLMIIGMLISSANKQVISDASKNGIVMKMGADLMSGSDSPMENLTLIRQVPTELGDYEVVYHRDSAGLEKNKKYYLLDFVRKNKDKKVVESFTLTPNVYMMKDNNLSSNPDTKIYLNKDVFTYISSALNEKGKEDTAQFKISEIAPGDTAFYSKGFVILDSIIKSLDRKKFNLDDQDMAIAAALTVVTKDSVRIKSTPVIAIHEGEHVHFNDDTLYAQNLYTRFAGVNDNKVKIGLKESDKLIDFVTVKSYVFPWIILVWVGLVVMAMGILLSMMHRAKAKGFWLAAVPIAVGVVLLYLFILGGQ